MTRCWPVLLDALARAGDDEAHFAAVDEARRALVGEGLLTVSAYDGEHSRLVRVWSSDRVAYPVGGSKVKADTYWTGHVLRRGEVFVGEGDAAIVEAFDDHDRIRGLGLHAIVNVPLLWHRRCIGTFNVLRAAQRWTADDVMHLRMLASVTLPVLVKRDAG